MPLYEYMEGGRLVERVLPVAERDRYPGRVTVPRRLNVITPAHGTEGEYASSEVMRGFYREECKNPGLNDTMREALGMCPGRIKEVWAEPDAPAREVPESVRAAAGAVE